MVNNRILFFTGLLLGIINLIHGQDTPGEVKSKMYFDNIPVANLWANSSNPAGTAFLDIDHINLVEAGYSFTENELKSPIEPGITNRFFLKTEGYKKIGSLTFFGSFGYDNELYQKIFNNNTLNFDIDNPYLLGDTIGGKQRKEGYLLRGSVSFPVSKRIILGIDADYKNYVGAKLKDPRNRNDISSLTVSPGIVYKGNGIMAGISGGPIVYNNNISISVMENAKYNLLQSLGLGYYKSIRNIYSYSNAYYGNGYQAETQFKYDKGSFSDLLIINYLSYREEVRYGTSFRLIDGISDKQTITLKNLQNIRKKDHLHQINLSAQMTTLSGTEVLQHFKTINAGSYSYDSLITDSWIEGKHIASNYNGELEYILTGYNGKNEKYKINAGFSAIYQTTYHYPVQNYGFQEVFNIYAFTGYKRYFILNSVTIVPEIELSYRKNLFRDMGYVVAELSLPELQKQDYISRYSDFVRGNAGILFMKKAGSKFFSEYFLNINGSYAYAPDKTAGPNTYFFFISSLGIIF